VKAWLGMALNDAEQVALGDSTEPAMELVAVDTSNWSMEVKLWLGVK
jgi:hypothetical protein